MVKLEFIDRDNSFALSRCGRFDLIRSFTLEYWQGFDWDTGRSVRGTRGECEQWCGGQLQSVEIERV